MRSAGATDLDPATYNAFIEGLELAGIEIVRLHAERTTVGIAEQTKFDLTASYMQDDAVIHYRYDLTAHLIDNKGTNLGNAAASVVVTARSVSTVYAACIEQFGATSGALIAHPYLREAVASSAERIGFPGVLLPMIKHQPNQETRE
jgi:hypothetical protein